MSAYPEPNPPEPSSSPRTSTASITAPPTTNPARPHRLQHREPSLLTGSRSGSATPSTRYGSFPPAEDAVAQSTHHQPTKSHSALLEQALRDAHASTSKYNPRRSRTEASSAVGLNRKWERSQERLLRVTRDGKSLDDSSHDDRDECAGSDDDNEDRGSESPLLDDVRNGQRSPDEVWNAGETASWGRRRAARNLRNNGTPAAIPSNTAAEDKQWGVVKMELMARTWGKKGLFTIYAGLYLISTLMSLEGNTTPTIEPYFLSLLGEHSMLSSVIIVTSITFAVGKPPFTKILDVFGRAEGVCLAAALYSLGYLLTACATDVKVFVFARALAALGGQGIQLAQQIIVADTTTLSNRGLITSTVSLPWLLTTWIGPPLGAFFQRQGPIGYRMAYATFGILLPLLATVLFCTLWLEWSKIKRKAMREGRTPSTRDLGIGVSTRAAWKVARSASVVEEGLPAPLHGRSSLSAVHEDDSDEADTIEYGRRDRRLSHAADAAANELSKRKRWRMSIWDKAAELWKDLDVVGLVALTVGCGAFLLPFTLAMKANHSWASPSIWGLILSGLALLVFFAYYETHMSSIPLLPPRLLKNRTIVGGSALGFFHFCSQFCYESFFTSFLQVARGHSPQDASYISQSYIFAACVAAIVAGSFAKMTNRYKWIGILGVLIHAVGVWLMMHTRNLDGSTFELVLSQLIGGVGGGFTTIAAQIGCQSVVGHQDVGIATAIFLTITQIGGAVGGALAGAVWSTVLPNRLRAHLDPTNHELIPEILSSLPYALSFPPDSPVRLAIDQSYVDVQKNLNWLAMAMLLPALVAVCSMKNVNLEKEDQGQGEGVVVLGRASFLACEDDVGDSETSSLLGEPPVPTR
ncbi:uncharacterized protein JCM15063_000971 [Sporobolomyces koalae]|uniref:uncharacterized protein n=1 Tax=Sporobolomyces koalae TaxID=500713 RepID=UPI0031773B05